VRADLDLVACLQQVLLHELASSTTPTDSRRMVACRADTVGPASTMSLSAWRPIVAVRCSSGNACSSPSFGRHTRVGCAPAAIGCGAAPADTGSMMRVKLGWSSSIAAPGWRRRCAFRA
jgi:hypothetical protein